MHTMTRPIYISRHGSGFRVRAYRGFARRTEAFFDTYEDAVAYANKKFATKYYEKACIIDETARQDAQMLAALDC